MFLGDSITNAGHYIDMVEAYLYTRMPDRSFTVVNLGLSSETIAGTSEPAHPWPRPDVHERLGRAILNVKPDVIAACYGMNDGNYYPFEPQRFAKYRSGIDRLIERCRAAKVRLTLMTPPAFDPVPVGVKGELADPNATEFSWMRPAANYDQTLDRYSRWLLTRRDDGFVVADLHAATNDHLAARRAIDGDFVMAGDGVHMDQTGHLIIAVTLLEAWNAPNEVDAATVNATSLTAAAGEVTDLRREADTLSFRWRTKLPMPIDPACDAKSVELLRVRERLNRQMLTITGLPAGRYTLRADGHAVGQFTHEQFAAGVNVAAMPPMPTTTAAGEVLKLIQQRRRTVDRAWLQHVGHKRPGEYPALPIDEALREHDRIEARLASMRRPRDMTIRIEPVN